MCMRACFVFALAVSVAACGRIGVHLLPLDGSTIERDAGGMDSPDAEPGGGGQFSDNIPVVLDAGLPRDAAMDAGPDAAQDAAMDASQDAAMDASQDAAMDASQDAAMDASQDAAMDASQDAGVDASMPACGGERVFGLCWYLAQANTSCNQECSNKGGFDTRAVPYVGTADQGGSIEECAEILTALGKPKAVVAAKRSDGNGLGCHVWSNGTDTYWLVDPPFSPSAAVPSGTAVRIACACTR
jgi:hypothetical protein